MKYIIIIFLFFSYKSVIAEDLLEPPIEIDTSENILNLNPVNLKKLKTRDIEKLLIGNVALGYFDNGDRYEETFSFINPGEEGNFNLKIIDNNDEVYTGTYKIVQSKVCFLTNGSDDWQCAVLYRNKENNNKYYWAQKNIIYAKITNIVNKEEYVELKNQQLKEEEERIAEEKRKAEEEKGKEEERIAEQKKKLIEDKYKKFKAKNDYQKNIIKFLHTIDAEFEDIRFSRRDNNIEIVNLNIEEIRINSLEIENINKDYLNIVINLINFEGNEVIKQFDEFVYAGQIFDNIKLSGLEINEDKDSYLKIGEIGFSDLDFEKYDQIKSLINIEYLDNTYNNFLSFVLSMKFDKIYFRDLVLEDSSEKMSIEYFEISDWNEFSFEKIQIDDGYFKSYENEVIFENLLIEEYLIDSEEMNKLISSNEALENLIIYNDFSQIFNSLKSLENFEIKNLQTRIENSDFYSFDTAKIRDLEFNYFGNSKDIKVPTSLEIEIIGSSFNPGVVNQEASILANELGYEEIKFDFITSWFWDTKKNNIEFNLENGLTDAGAINILTNISDLNSDILSIQGAPLMTYLMTTPKLKEFNITVSDKSLKNKIINYAAKQQNMSSDQFRNFLSQSLSLLATTFGVNAENYEEYFTSISNFINDSDKLIISLEPNKPISINDLMPDIMSQNYSGIFDKMKLEIRN